MHLSVVAPDRTIFEDNVSSVVAPGVLGYFGIQPGHEPLIAALDTGIVEVREPNGNKRYVSITGGFLEVSEGNVIILADGGMHSDEIDVAAAEAEVEIARKVLRNEDASMTKEEATAMIRRATNNIKASRMR